MSLMELVRPCPPYAHRLPNSNSVHYHPSPYNYFLDPAGRTYIIDASTRTILNQSPDDPSAAAFLSPFTSYEEAERERVEDALHVSPAVMWEKERRRRRAERGGYDPWAASERPDSPNSFSTAPAHSPALRAHRRPTTETQPTPAPKRSGPSRGHRSDKTNRVVAQKAVRSRCAEDGKRSSRRQQVKASQTSSSRRERRRRGEVSRETLPLPSSSSSGTSSSASDFDSSSETPAPSARTKQRPPRRSQRNSTRPQPSKLPSPSSSSSSSSSSPSSPPRSASSSSSYSTSSLGSSSSSWHSSSAQSVSASRSHRRQRRPRTAPSKQPSSSSSALCSSTSSSSSSASSTSGSVRSPTAVLLARLSQAGVGLHQHAGDPPALSLHDTAVEQTTTGLVHVLEGLHSLAPSPPLPSSAPVAAASSLTAPLSLSRALLLREALRRRERCLHRTHEAALEELRRAQLLMDAPPAPVAPVGRAFDRTAVNTFRGWTGGGHQRAERQQQEEERRVHEEDNEEERTYREYGYEEDEREEGAMSTRSSSLHGLTGGSGGVREVERVALVVPSTLEPYWYERRDAGFRAQLREYKHALTDLDRAFYGQPASTVRRMVAG